MSRTAWITASLAVAVAIGGMARGQSAYDRSNASNRSQATRGQESAGFTDSVSGFFRKAGAALTPQPKVVKAADPIRLSSEPGPVGPDLHVATARLMENQGIDEKAIGQYETALKKAPQHRDALIGLARLRQRLGDIDQAVQLYGRTIRAHPADPVAFNDVSFCHVQRGEHHRAISAVAEAVRLEPTNVRYRNNLARLLVLIDRPDEALEQLQAVHAEAVAHYNLGYLLHQHGRTPAAADHLTRALQLDRSLNDARQMLVAMGRMPADGSQFAPISSPREVQNRYAKPVAHPDVAPATQGPAQSPPPVAATPAAPMAEARPPATPPVAERPVALPPPRQPVMTPPLVDQVQAPAPEPSSLPARAPQATVPSPGQAGGYQRLPATGQPVRAQRSPLPGPRYDVAEVPTIRIPTPQRTAPAGQPAAPPLPPAATAVPPPNPGARFMP